MPHEKWVSVAEYGDRLSAEVASGLLSGMGIPHYLHRLPWEDAQRFIWVPADRVVEAKHALKGGSLSDEELTQLAMNYPPPDDI